MSAEPSDADALVDPAPGCWLAERARLTPRATAIEYAGGAMDGSGGRSRDGSRAGRFDDSPSDCIDYATLHARAERLAAKLRDAGVRPGDVVGALLDNGVELPVLLWALHALGGVLLPLSWRLTPGELAAQLADARPVLLVHAGGERAEAARAAAARVPPLACARMDAAGGLDGPSVASGSRGPGDPLLAGAMALLYTSGTSGRPKGAVLGPEAFRASAEASARLVGARAADRWLACMPLFHVGGLSILVRSCLAGGAAVVHRRFDPEAVARALDDDGITVVSLVAAMLDRVLAARRDRPPPPALRCVLLGGGPTPAPLLERAVAAGLPVAPTYGLTEAASQVATRLPEDREPPLDARLRPLPGTTVRIVDEAGGELGPGVPGEIVVRGPTLMRGYLGLPEATRRALRDGWLHTSDVGVLDAEGRLAVLDRRDDLIVSGGENVYPAEVEAVLERHPAVAEAAVTAVADARFGARPVAWWVPVDPAVPDPDLAAHCRAALAPFKVPVAFHRRTSLPRGPSGKLLRRALREESGA